MHLLLIEVFKRPDLKNSNTKTILGVGLGSLELRVFHYFTISEHSKFEGLRDIIFLFLFSKSGLLNTLIISMINFTKTNNEEEVTRKAPKRPKSLPLAKTFRVLKTVWLLLILLGDIFFIISFCETAHTYNRSILEPGFEEFK